MRDVVHIANVSADDLSQFYPPLSSPLLMMSNQNRVRKIPSDTFCTEIFSAENALKEEEKKITVAS